MSEKNKRTIAMIMLFVLIFFALILTYSKYLFNNTSDNIPETSVNESSSNAIHEALKEITTNFNKNPEVIEYANINNIQLTASINNYSIYISYIDFATVTYEFTYEDLCLNTIQTNADSNQEKFNLIYKFLIKAVQERIKNDTELDELITNFLNNDINYEGLTKEKEENKIKYQINITKKLRMED